MATPSVFRDVSVAPAAEDGSPVPPRFTCPADAHVIRHPSWLSVRIVRAQPDPAHATELLHFLVTATSECARAAPAVYLFTVEDQALFVRFASPVDCENLHVQVLRLNSTCSLFGRTQRTIELSTSELWAQESYACYGNLYHQQGMMKDFIRTCTYRQAILNNEKDFQNKVVLDAGAGTGVLSHFALQAGARKVYAVEASSMAHYAQMLVQANGLQGSMEVIAGKIEEIELPEQVDIIISEPMGIMLFHERMIETYLHAKKWLRPGGAMFPAHANLHIAPFTDKKLFAEQCEKGKFWDQNFYGVDLRQLQTIALKEIFSQPIIDTFDIGICISKSVRYNVDFLKANETDLHRFEVPFRFKVTQSALCHGLAFWFDVTFIGTKFTVDLSTSPEEALTNWQQVRGLLQTPISVKKGQYLTGRVKFLANKCISYDVAMEMTIEGTTTSSSNLLHLQNYYVRMES